jgi:uncharacterized 2Fe-2S/4Fe-4S cluster protein (DUF4445 family)
MWGGLINEEERIEIIKGLILTQQDIREMQLAKGAISAGIQILAQKMGVSPEDIDKIYIAGAFGNYINLANARTIGLIEYPEEKVTKLGNSALIGAKMLLYYQPDDLPPILHNIQHTSLETDPEFQEIYAMKMLFQA